VAEIKGGTLVRLSMMLLAVIVTIGQTGCGFKSSGTPEGAVVGRAGLYDYSPSVTQSGDVRQFWWCGQGVNPNNSSQASDTILYESINLTSHVTYGPVVVLAESAGAWDSAYTCNPKVIEGIFNNPLGDNQTYTYAMYYVGTASIQGVNNSIGVAFSNDGAHWKKYPQPVILSTSQGGYGVGQPALFNSNRKAAIWMFYEDNTPTVHHVEAISTDGVHFTTQGTLSTNGLDPDNSQPSWGDMAYDAAAGYWYAAFNLSVRDPATVGGISERGQYGIELYRIPSGSLLSGSTPWQQLGNFDTNLTGNEVNFLPGFLRDPYGNVNIGPYPTIEMFTSFSNPQPAWNASPAVAGTSGTFPNWDIGSTEWVPGSPLVAFKQYFNKSVHEATTGWIDPNGGFTLEATLGHLYQSPQGGATVAFYGCKDGSTDYFVSLDSSCEGQRILGSNGYGYAEPVAGLKLTALYRCSDLQDHFISTDPKCEGQTTDELLGYVVP
jgi:hypothetical protein